VRGLAGRSERLKGVERRLGSPAKIRKNTGTNDDKETGVPRHWQGGAREKNEEQKRDHRTRRIGLPVSLEIPNDKRKGSKRGRSCVVTTNFSCLKLRGKGHLGGSPESTKTGLQEGGGNRTEKKGANQQPVGQLDGRREEKPEPS